MLMKVKWDDKSLLQQSGLELIRKNIYTSTHYYFFNHILNFLSLQNNRTLQKVEFHHINLIPICWVTISKSYMSYMNESGF